MHDYIFLFNSYFFSNSETFGSSSSFGFCVNIFTETALYYNILY